MNVTVYKERNGIKYVQPGPICISIVFTKVKLIQAERKFSPNFRPHGYGILMEFGWTDLDPYYTYCNYFK